MTAARIDAGASVTECTSSKALASSASALSRDSDSLHTEPSLVCAGSVSVGLVRSGRLDGANTVAGLGSCAASGRLRSQSRCIHWQQRARRSLPRVQPPGTTFIRGYLDVVWTRSRQMAPVAALLGYSGCDRPRARRCRSARTAATRAVLARRAGRTPRPPGVGRALPRCARVIRRVGRQRRGRTR